MKKLKKSTVIWYSAQEMYELVIDAESYPKFLPWCSSARILERYPDGLLAVLGLSIAGVQKSFTTRTYHVPGKSVRVELVEGPFSALNCYWSFENLPASAGSEEVPRACRVNFEAEYGFSNRALALVIGLIFDKMMDTYVDAFIKRAEVVYGNNVV